MSTDGVPSAQAARPTIFLSYASEDRDAARAIRDTLTSLGLDVWYDESDLDGGDVWDQKIRRQIRECDFFMPVVSAQTESRAEGYFRREWRFAVERTLDMADDHIFLLPVSIDDTDEGIARVPEKFLAVQWTRLPAGKSTPAFEALCGRLASGQAVTLARSVPATLAPAHGRGRARGRRRERDDDEPRPEYSPFPKAQPGESGARHYRSVVFWVFHSAWVAFKRLPKWVRILIYIWVVLGVMARACSGRPG